MTKIIPFVIFLMCHLSFFAQDAHNFTATDFLKDYERSSSFTKIYEIDSSHLMIQADIEKARKWFYVTINYEDNTFKTTKIIVPRDEYSRTIWNISGFYMHDDKVNFILCEKVKKECLFFHGQVIGDKFTISSNPFYKDLSFYHKKDLIDFNNDKIIVQSRKQKYYEGTPGPISEIEHNFFSKNNLSFISSNKIIFPEKGAGVKEVFYEHVNNQLFMSYGYGVQHYFSITPEKISEVNFGDDNSILCEGSILFPSNNKLYFYGIQQKDNKFINILYEYDGESFEMAATSTVDPNLIFEGNVEHDRFNKKYTFYTEYYNGENNTLYFMSYPNTYDGFMYDVMISKFEGNEIKWNQYIERSGRPGGVDKFNVDFTSDPITLLINDREIFLNEKGEYKEYQNEVMTLSQKFVDIKYLINKDTGSYEVIYNK